MNNVQRAKLRKLLDDNFDSYSEAGRALGTTGEHLRYLLRRDRETHWLDMARLYRMTGEEAFKPEDFDNDTPTGRFRRFVAANYESVAEASRDLKIPGDTLYGYLDGRLMIEKMASYEKQKQIYLMLGLDAMGNEFAGCSVSGEATSAQCDFPHSEIPAAAGAAAGTPRFLVHISRRPLGSGSYQYFASSLDYKTFEVEETNVVDAGFPELIKEFCKGYDCDIRYGEGFTPDISRTFDAFLAGNIVLHREDQRSVSERWFEKNGIDISERIMAVIEMARENPGRPEFNLYLSELMRRASLAGSGPAV